MAARGGENSGVGAGGQTVGNIIAARAERNYRFALGVPSFFPIPSSSSLGSAKLHLSSFILLRSSPRSRLPGRPPFFQSPGIANNFHNSRLESFPPRTESGEGASSSFSISVLLSSCRPSSRPPSFCFSFLLPPLCAFLLAESPFSRQEPTSRVLKKGDENQNRLRSKPSTLITLGIHHSRSDPLKFGFHIVDDESDHDWGIFDTRHSAGRDIFHSATVNHHVSKTLITFSRGEEWIMMFAKA